jgi:hypothetical protein
MLDETAHSRLRDAATSEDLHGIPRGILCTPSGIHLQKGDLACKLSCLFLVRLPSASFRQLLIRDCFVFFLTTHHIAHLVRDILQPRLQRF